MVPHNKHYLMLFLIAMLLPFTIYPVHLLLSQLYNGPTSPAQTPQNHILHHSLTQCKVWGKESCGKQKRNFNFISHFKNIPCYCLSPNMSIINDPNIFQINIATKNNLLSISGTYLLFSLYLQFYILATRPTAVHSTHEYWIFIPLLSMIV